MREGALLRHGQVTPLVADVGRLDLRDRVRFPDWWARWFEVVPTWETLGAQLLAAGLVVGSYFLAEHVKVRALRRRGEAPAVRAAEPSPQTH